jgi:hypothetical protein
VFRAGEQQRAVAFTRLLLRTNGRQPRRLTAACFTRDQARECALPLRRCARSRRPMRRQFADTLASLDSAESCRLIRSVVSMECVQAFDDITSRTRGSMQTLCSSTSAQHSSSPPRRPIPAILALPRPPVLTFRDDEISDMFKSTFSG